MVNADELLRFLVRKRLQDDSVQDAEHRRVRADAKGQRQQHDRRELWRRQDRAQGVLQVEEHAVHV